ncbi:hypothetical protein G6O67_006544 [Ophiocordyceps sinensis]|uniref:Uncharacterized protein n=1 Tax=Ophiocordyceps sinensis TaxID=72228 RepID=A0A8H4LVQ8_9HYPO|nr:hypothetical protein G6O67_006544 [Ophiocordyceps sinensis]
MRLIFAKGTSHIPDSFGRKRHINLHLSKGLAKGQWSLTRKQPETSPKRKDGRDEDPTGDDEKDANSTLPWAWRVS